MIATNHSNIFVAAMWRSGSTHIARGLGQMLEWRPASTAGYHGEGQEQQDINPFSAAILMPYGYQVFHQHCWGTVRNASLLRDLKVPTVVVTRSVPDTIVSIYERLHALPSFVIPGLPIQPDWHSWDRDRQYEWLARTVTPWQCQFALTWRASKVPVHRIHYRRFYADQHTGFTNLLNALDIDPSRVNIDEAVSAKHNLSVGLSGRGDTMPAKALGIVSSTLIAMDCEDLYE